MIGQKHMLPLWLPSRGSVKAWFHIMFSVQLESVSGVAEEGAAKQRRLRIIMISVIGGLVLVTAVFGILYAVMKSNEVRITDILSSTGTATSDLSHKASSVLEPVVVIQPISASYSGFLSKLSSFIRLRRPYFVGAGIVLVLAVLGLTLGLVLTPQQAVEADDGVIPPKEMEENEITFDEVPTEQPTTSLQTILISVFSVVGVIVLIIISVIIYQRCKKDNSKVENDDVIVFAPKVSSNKDDQEISADKQTGSKPGTSGVDSSVETAGNSNLDAVHMISSHNNAPKGSEEFSSAQSPVTTPSSSTACGDPSKEPNLISSATDAKLQTPDHLSIDNIRNLISLLNPECMSEITDDKDIKILAEFMGDTVYSEILNGGDCYLRSVMSVLDPYLHKFRLGNNAADKIGPLNEACEALGFTEINQPGMPNYFSPYSHLRHQNSIHREFVITMISMVKQKDYGYNDHARKEIATAFRKLIVSTKYIGLCAILCNWRDHPDFRKNSILETVWRAHPERQHFIFQALTKMQPMVS